VAVRAALAVVTVGVLAGEIAGGGGQLPPAGLAVASIAPAGAWLAGGRRWTALLWLALGLGAAGVGAARLHAGPSPRLPADHVARLTLPLRTTLLGRVVAPPARRGDRTVLVVAAHRAGGVRVSGRVRLTIRRSPHHWRYGDRLRAPAVLRAPRNFENPGRFDWVGHLARRGVHVTAFVWDGATVARWPARGRGLRAGIEAWRERLAATIDGAVPPPEGPVLRALVTGESASIDPDLREAFARAGVAHILSVSGLHVALVAGATFAGVRWLLARSGRVLLAVDVEGAAACASLLPVALYAVVAGLGVATLRSALMVAAAVVVRLRGGRADVLGTLTLSALLLCLLWPGTALEVSFQLSFASVLAIVCGTRRLGPPARPVTGGWHGRLARLRTAALVSSCALVGTAPLTALHFHQVSLIGPIANLPIVPIFGIVVVLALGATVLEPVAPGAAALLFQGGGLVLRPALALTRVLAAPGWAAVDVPVPSPLELALVYALLAGLLLLPRLPARALVLVAVAGLLTDAAWWTHRRLDDRWLRVTFLDVGQGDGAVAELPGGKVVVIDAGGFPGSDFDTGEAVVAPFLGARKIGRLEAVAMTHAHPDHSGGLPHLLAHHRPKEFWWTGVPATGPAWERLQTALAGSGARVRLLTEGTVPPGVAGLVEVLHPAPGSGGSLNDSSLTLRLRHGRLAVLLTGDIEARAEGRLLRSGARLGSAVLKVPHHGSRTSSTAPFVARVAPAVAIMSVGADNRYNLPAPEVEARYRALGVCVLRTDRCGAITVETDGRRLRLRTHRPGCHCPAPTDMAGARPVPRYAALVSPWRSAYITRPTRSRTPSFWKMLVRWVLTVRSLMVSVPATSLFL
jgi:competence protein ComEC